MAVVVHHPAADKELDALPAAERKAMDHALDKLEVMEEHLPYPHQSAVRDAKGIRELRPRAGRSPWRGFYVRVGDVFVFLGVGPEAEVDEKGFRRAVRDAQDRLDELTKEDHK